MSRGIVDTIAGGALIAAGVLIEVGTLGGGTPLAIALITAGAGLVLTGIGTMLKGNVQGFATTTRNPIAPWEIPYGRTRIGGTIVYLAQFGDKNKWLDMVIVLAACGIASVDELLFDNQRIQIGHFSDGSGFNISFTPLQQTVLIDNTGDITRSGNVVTVVLHHDIPLLSDGDQVIVQGVHPVNLFFNGKFPVFNIIHTPGSPGAVTFSYLSGGPAVPGGGTVVNSGEVHTTWADYKKNVYLETIGDSGPYNRLGHTQSLGETFVGMTNGTPKQGDTGSLVQNNANFPNPWTADCSLVGMTAAFIRLEYDATLFPGGIPQISFLVHGKNDILDPRTSPPTIGYSENAALCIADYLANKQYGFKCNYGTDIHLPNLIAAANICDEPVALAEPRVSPPRTEPRYTCCGHFNVGMKRGEILQNMLTSCAGRLTYIGGQFSIWPAAWRGVSMTLDMIGSPPESWVLKNAAGPIQWRSSVSISNLYNGVKGTYISPVNNWQSSDFPRYAQDGLHGYTWSSPTYSNDLNLEHDGGDRRWLDIQLPFTISCPTAQRLAKIELMRRRQQGTGTFLLNMAGYQLVPPDILSMTLAYFGWTNKYLEVLAARFKLDRQQDSGQEVTLLGVEIDVQETDPSVYDWEVIEELSPQGYQQPGVPDTLFTPDPPSNLYVAFNDQGAAALNWTAPLDAFVVSIEGRYQPVASPPGIWIELGIVPDSVTQMRLPPLIPGQLYVLELRSMNAAGVPSIWVSLNYTPISLPPQWQPYQVVAGSDDALFPNEHSFDVALAYTNLMGGQASMADGSALARLNVQGVQPVNEVIPGCPAPIIVNATVNPGGGSLPDGLLLYITVTADDGAGNYALPAPVFQVQIPVQSPPSNANSIDLQIAWPDGFPGLVNYTVYASPEVDLICAQQWGGTLAYGPTSPPDSPPVSVYTPTNIELSGPASSPPAAGLIRSTWAPPNPNLRIVRLKGTIGYHLGVLGAKITSISGNILVSTDCVDLASPPSDNWTGRILAIIGRNNGDVPLSSVPFWSANITAFDPTTGTFTLDRSVASSPPDDNDPRSDDVFVVCTKGYDNSGDPYQVHDAGWSNALNFDFATGVKTPHSGLTVKLEQGMILRVIRGTSRGAKANILANTGTTHILDAPVHLAADSVWVIVEAGWPYAMDSTLLDNKDPFQSLSILLPVSNFGGQSMFLAAHLVDFEGQESDDGDVAMRMVFVYGAPGGGQVVQIAQTT